MNFEERAYLSDPYKTEFISKVRLSEKTSEGNTLVFLEKTWFYPESGGQPDDRGTLAGKPVLAVTEEERGVAHLVKGVIGKGEEVEGRIDFDRRFDHMQQHTGQHLLSRVFQERFGLKTVGFHMGQESSTIDLEGNPPSGQSIREVELSVNALVTRNLTVTMKVVSPTEYQNIMARGDSGMKPRSRVPEGKGKLRLVDIESVDINACCGTHVSRTGEIGLLKITGSSRVRQNTRIDFLCGRRALEDYIEKDKMINSIALSFSTGWNEVESMVDKLGKETGDLRKEVKKLKEELAPFRAASLSEPDGTIGGIPLIKKVIEDLGAGEVRRIAGEIKSKPPVIVLFGISKPSPALIFARSGGIDLDVSELLEEAAAVMGARGGGGQDFAQGGGGDSSRLSDALDRAEKVAREKLE
jgi:alanyl-tRNA synthetase